jgi:endonuclease YncB( thermonuclease family)
MNYKSLIKTIKGRLDAIDRISNDNTTRLATLENVWMTGKDLDTYTRETGKTTKDIAVDVDEAEGSLQKFVRFYRLYPERYASEIGGKPIGWSHYAAVLYIGNSQVRDFYLNEAATQSWSSHELRRRIRNNYYENRQEHSTIEKQKSAKLKAIEQKLYTYSAEVLKVVDADTLELDIDVGFNTWMKHKVRLRGINCPELKTKKGEKAKKFVEKELTDSAHASDAIRYPLNAIRSTQVIIRTYRTEKFGRYLVDLWYLNGEANKEQILSKGNLLNQVLLDEGLAEKVE